MPRRREFGKQCPFLCLDTVETHLCSCCLISFLPLGFFPRSAHCQATSPLDLPAPGDTHPRLSSAAWPYHARIFFREEFLRLCGRRDIESEFIGLHGRMLLLPRQAVTS
jgi:hypothetical protein